MKRIKIKYAKLGRQKSWGLAHSDGQVILDSSLKGRKHLEILLHECIHILYPENSEDEVIANSIILTNTLWHEKYRRIDDNKDLPLQDGSK